MNSEQAYSGEARSAHRSPYGRCDSRHEILVTAEIRRLVRELLALGPMPKEKLATVSGVAHWSEGTLDEALSAGEQAGLLRRLPLGWVEATSVAR